MAETTPDLTTEFIARMLAYTDELTYFGENSTNLAIAKAAGGQAAGAYTVARSARRRYTLIGAQDDDLTIVAQEWGAERQGANRGLLLVVFRAWTAVVLSLDSSTIEVDDSSHMDVGDSLRIRSEDGTTTEIVHITSISAGTGPNGGDELGTTAIANTYDTSTEVRVLLRRLVQSGSTITTRSGVSFQTLADLTVGDLNPLLDGESQALALSDKVYAECTTLGAAGAVDAYTVTGLETPDPKIRDVLNPERSNGAVDLEADFELKRRASHRSQMLGQETSAWLEALAHRGSRQVLRCFARPAEVSGTLGGVIMARNGGGLSPDALAALESHLNQRVRSGMVVALENIVPTSVEIEATITLDPGITTARQRLKAAWKAAADRYAAFIDFRKWQTGQAVDAAALISILDQTPGVRSIMTSTFLPSAAVPVDTYSLPVFTRLQLTDEASGIVINASLTASF